MPRFEIETPQGRFEVDAPDETTAVRALQGGASRLTGDDRNSPIPNDLIEEGKARVDTAMRDRERTVSGAVTTWLENAIEGIPVVGPAIQKGSDILYTETVGRLSGQDPEKMREDITGRRAERDEEYPLSSLSGTVAGTVGSLGGVGATAGGARALGIAGKTIAGRTTASGASGAAISGADTVARGGDSNEVFESMAVGGGVGAAIPAAGGAIRRGVEVVGEKLPAVVRSVVAPEREAGRRVGTAFARDAAANASTVAGAADEAAAREAGIPLLNVDRGGETTRALARSVANQSPEARSVIEKTASDRFASQGQRAVEFIRRMAGGNVDDIGTREAIRETARMANKPAYRKAYDSPRAQDMWNEGYEQLMQAPAMQKAARQATGRGANRAAAEGFQPVKNPFTEIDGRLILRTNPDGSVAKPTLQFWDQVKRNLDSDIGKAERAGDRTLASDLKSLKGTLVGMLDESVPDYRAARQGAASFFEAEDALDAGKKFANSPRSIPEARKAFEKFSEADKIAFRTGYASELIDKIKAARDRTNVIKQVFGTQSSRESMELAFGKTKAREIEAYVRVEDIADRLRGAMGNSTTARQLVELGIGAGGGFAVSGDWKGAAAGALAAKGLRIAGQRSEAQVMQRVADMLTSNDPKIIEQAVRQAALSPKYMNALKSIGRVIDAPARGTAMASTKPE